MTIAIVLLVWTASVAAGVLLGRRKNRKGFPYGFLLPVLGVVVLALLPARRPRDVVLGTKWDETRRPTSDSFFQNAQYYSKH